MLQEEGAWLQSWHSGGLSMEKDLRCLKQILGGRGKTLRGERE